MEFKQDYLILCKGKTMERLLEKNTKNRENISNKWINYFDTWNLPEFDFEAVEDLEDFILDLKKHDEFEKANILEMHLKNASERLTK